MLGNGVPSKPTVVKELGSQKQGIWHLVGLTMSPIAMANTVVESLGLLVAMWVASTLRFLHMLFPNFAICD